MSDIYQADLKAKVLRRIEWEPLEFFRQKFDYNALPVELEPVRVLKVVDEIPLSRMELMMLRSRAISPGELYALKRVDKPAPPVRLIWPEKSLTRTALGT